MKDNIIWRKEKKAQVPECEELVGLSCVDVKGKNGASLIHGTHDKPMAWVIMVPSILAQSNLYSIFLRAGAAVENATLSRNQNRWKLWILNYLFQQQMGAEWSWKATELIHEIGKRMSLINGAPREIEYFFQHISIAN